ncbi:proline-rich receptor-like protein kinase PERK8 [Setaria italica]|uniref:proline-rich receptor-like protein kinase PERK8 n=1 Tax=Setaria italica TaxID=4555 RepID=UPI000350D0E4|nr:proline-rich receptor-like protein kinase PERK8 [Setaria italica]
MDAAHRRSISTRSLVVARRHLTRPAASDRTVALSSCATPLRPRARPTLSACAPVDATASTNRRSTTIAPSRLANDAARQSRYSFARSLRSTLARIACLALACRATLPPLSANGTTAINGRRSALTPSGPIRQRRDFVSLAAPPRPYKWRPDAACAPFPACPRTSLRSPALALSSAAHPLHGAPPSVLPRTSLTPPPASPPPHEAQALAGRRLQAPTLSEPPPPNAVLAARRPSPFRPRPTLSTLPTAAK